MRTHDVPAHEPTRRRSRLLLPLFVLLGSEIFHIAATVANDGEPTAHHAQFGPPAHIGAALFTIGLIVWVRRGGRYGAELTAATGAAVVVAATVYHLLPVDSDFTNSFWDGATAAQQVSVFIGILAGAWCVARALGPSREQTDGGG